MATHTLTKEDLSLERTTTLERTPTFVNRKRRSSAIELHTSDSATLRLSRSTSRPNARNDIEPSELLSLTRSVSRISGHNEAYQESRLGRPNVTRPKAAKAGPYSTIREVESQFTTPLSSRPVSPIRLLTISRPPSPSLRPETEGLLEIESDEESDLESLTGINDASGRLSSWRGATILGCVCGAQLMDNVFMTGVNISLPSIQQEFNVPSSDLQWLISAYTLTFGGFLLLAGVLADRYGRRRIFVAGMLWLTIWTISCGFASSFIQMAIFRALQGIGAAATVPSGVGIISSYYQARDRTRGLSMFGAAGAVGFCVGLILGGFLTSSLGWRWLFYLSVLLTGPIAIAAWFILPHDRFDGEEKPQLDLLGAGLSTGGLILLSFVLSSGGVYGWNKAFIIALLILSMAALALFIWAEKKARNPIMPLGLWKLQNFAALWVAGFVIYGGYQTVVYYTTLIAQEVEHLSASATAIRYLPMGCTGFIISLSMARAVEIFDTKLLLLAGMTLSAIAPISAVTMTPGNISFWEHIFPTTVLVVAGVTIVYCTITVVLLASVPDNVKSMCGGMINTAFQIGSGVGLALSTAVVDAVDVKKGHGQLKQYSTGLLCCVGLGVVGFCSALTVKNTGKARRGQGIVVH